MSTIVVRGVSSGMAEMAAILTRRVSLWELEG